MNLNKTQPQVTTKKTINAYLAGHMWSVTNSSLESIIAQHIKGEALAENSVESPADDAFESNVFVLRVDGTISPYYTYAVSKFLSFLENEGSVDAVVLNVESGGGTIPGVEDLRNQIKNYSKPIVTYTSGMMASAAYWFGSAARKIVAQTTAELGSIGVRYVHVDQSEMMKKAGVNMEFLSAGDKKNVGAPNKPLSDEDRASIKAELDTMHAIFKSAVAENRKGIDIEAVSDGSVFIGEEAVKLGLADKIGGLNTAVAEAKSLIKGDKMFKTKDELKEAQPDLYAEVFEAGKQAAKETAEVETVDRILGFVKAQCGDTEAEAIATVVKSGATLEMFQAIQAVVKPKQEAKADDNVDADAEALKAAKAAELEKIKQASKATGDVGTDASANVDFTVLVAACKEEKKCSTEEAQNIVAKANPEAFTNYIQKMNGGK